jgi:hypothetical protein
MYLSSQINSKNTTWPDNNFIVNKYHLHIHRHYSTDNLGYTKRMFSDVLDRKVLDKIGVIS